MEWKNLQLRKQLSIADGFIILLATFLLVNLCIDSGLFPVVWLSDRLPGGATTINQMLVQQMLQVSVMIGLTLVFLYPLRGGNLRQIGLRAMPQKSWIWKSLLSGVALFILMLLVTMGMTALFPQWAHPQTVAEMIMQADGAWEWTAAVLTVCVLAPLSEELLFRGYIYHSLRNHYSMLLSVLVTSLLFGCMHGDFFRLLPLTLTGVCLNLVSIRAGSLWGSIIMHSTWNFMMLLLMIIF